MALWIVAGGESFDELTGEVDAINNSFLEANSGVRAGYYFVNASLKQLIATLKGNRDRVWARFYIGRNAQLGAGKPFLMYFDGANERLRFSLVFVAGVGTCVKCETVNGATLATLFTTTLPFYAETAGANGLAAVLGTFHIDVNYTAAGWVRVYRDTALAGEFIGNPRVGGSTTLSDGKIQNPNTGGGWAEASFQQVIFGDEDTRGMKISTHWPNANGDVNTFSSASFANIDEQGEAGTDFNESLVAGQKFLANCSDMIAAFGTNPVMHSLIVRSRAQGASAGSGGPSKFKHLLKTGGVEYQGPSQTPSNAAMTLIGDAWATNPATGLTWTRAEINAIQLGHLSEA